MQNSIHVTPNGDDWQVKRAGAQRASKVCATQAECINIGKEMAKKSNSELYIHNTQGQIRAKNSYGNDPRDIKG
ncbi:MAG: DUF2188 domain-containing protein [Campylobacterota bacterium]|nr:DUF2188 domain-containing protein [Campylobacterota bacterium]